jgi:hypothetical protein
MRTNQEHKRGRIIEVIEFGSPLQIGFQLEWNQQLAGLSE